MVNITHKSSTLRKAIAVATIKVSDASTIDAVRNDKVPKGDIMEFSRAAGLLAIKKTSDVIPDCHPLPVEYAGISYAMQDLTIQVRVEVHTIYKTGVEVEAMHGAAITALTIYDMLKPLDKGVEITGIKLEEKTGGKTGLTGSNPGMFNCAVIVCSDSVAAGKAEDKTGKTIIEKLKQFGLDTTVYETIPDQADIIKQKAEDLGKSHDIVLFAGGTGLSPRDLTPDAIKPLLDVEIPGIMETARAYGQARMPYAMLSRGIAGFIGKAFVMTLPGSPRGAEETMDALFPHVLHVFSMKRGDRH